MVDRLIIATVPVPQRMTPRLSRRVTVGKLATYLSSVEANIEAPTLEHAQPVNWNGRLQDVGLAGGDRLLLVLREPQTASFASPPQAGDVMLQLSDGAYTFRSQGKHGLLAGVPDGKRSVPDVDLRRVVAGPDHTYLSRSTLWFAYAGRQWTVRRTGQTRVRLDDFELTDAPAPISDGQQLSFYRASDNPRHATPLGHLVIHLDVVTQPHHTPALEMGTEPVPVWLGVEATEQHVQVSGVLPLQQLITRLAAYNQMPLTDQAMLYRLRLVAPSTRITALNLAEDEVLYAPYTTPPAGVMLLLQATHDLNHQFELRPADREFLLGCRLQPSERVPALDVDLYDLFAARQAAPHHLGLRTPFLARLRYADLENTWWVRQPERLPVNIFVNTTRIDSAGVPLLDGDVLTLGDTLDTYYARLEVATTTPA